MSTKLQLIAIFTALLGTASAFAPTTSLQTPRSDRADANVLFPASSCSLDRSAGISSASRQPTALAAARIKYLTEIDDDNYAEVLSGDKAVLIDACATVRSASRDFFLLCIFF